MIKVKEYTCEVPFSYVIPSEVISKYISFLSYQSKKYNIDEIIDKESNLLNDDEISYLRTYKEDMYYLKLFIEYQKNATEEVDNILRSYWDRVKIDDIVKRKFTEIQLLDCKEIIEGKRNLDDLKDYDDEEMAVMREYIDFKTNFLFRPITNSELLSLAHSIREDIEENKQFRYESLVLVQNKIIK